MLRKIGQLAGVSLKFFFDLDYAVCHHALLMVLVGAGLCRLFVVNIASAFSNSWCTVKEDFLTLKMDVACYVERWKNSEAREMLISNLGMLKNNFTKRVFRG